MPQTDRATDSAALNRVVFPWLDRHHDEPFFLYAHATDPHAPYEPPPPFRSMFANPRRHAAFQSRILTSSGRITSTEEAR